MSIVDVSTAATSARPSQKQSPPLIMFNDDTCSLRYVNPPHDDASLNVPLRHLVASQVGALCWCMGEDIAYSWPSKVVENYYQQLAAGHWIGLVDDEVGFGGILEGKGEYYEKLPPGVEPRNVMVTLHNQGVDYLPEFIQRTKDCGVKFIGSFRMNDCHLKSDPRGMLSSKFWQEHQDWRLWEVTDGRTYYNAALDYSHPEVRQRRLSVIRETLEWYDQDGIELDWCRNPYVFQPSEAWNKRHILTDFIRNVRNDMNDAEMRWGHKLDLVLRVPISEKMIREAGMDIHAWLDERLFDALVMSDLENNYNRTLEPWLSHCRDAGVAFYPSIELGPAHNAIHNHITIETADETVRRMRGMAQNYLGQGAAGVYVFNYPCALFQQKRTPEEMKRMTGVLNEIGRGETLAGKQKQFTFWKNLPLQIESRRPARFHQTIRFNVFDSDLSSAQTKVQLSFRQATEPNPHVDLRHLDKLPEILPPGWVTYWLNEQEVPEAWIRREPRPAGKIASGLTLPAHEKITITPPASAMKVGQNTLGFFVPRFPEETDPYVHVYELIADVN